MLQALVRDYSWIHLGLGLIGNFCFVVGSVLFFKTFDAWYTTGVWLFVIGSIGMFVGSLGELAKSLYERREKRES
ncbi:YrhK family protein [Aurantimonas sp. VKM B-3413]|uniref:YrhK family protein n=1 Tax=Aurantimonas sp. VKM B-3413 TaxID=2779401 RepID=UPI001E4F9C7A|nr:YrhK family protein [Aurantimonas sp. VKM B-3413]MCB8836506.1 YrhK family protein [Aurantimonas sp. VKM B-3413]